MVVLCADCSYDHLQVPVSSEKLKHGSEAVILFYLVRASTQVSNDDIVPGVDGTKDSASGRTPDHNSSNGNFVWGYLHNMSTRARTSANLLHS